MPFNIFAAYEKERKLQRVIQTEDSLNKLIDRLKNTNHFAFDVETNSLDTIDADLLGVGFAIGNDSWYIPIGHTTPHTQLSWDFVLSKIAPIFSDDKTAKIGHNIKFDIKILENKGIRVKGLLLDTLIMVWLCQEENVPRGLKESAKRDLGFNMRNFSDINGGDLVNASIYDVAKYCRMDCKATLALYHFYKPIIQEEELSEVFKIETDLIPVTMAMEKEGMLIDREKLAELGRQLQEHIQELTPQIHKLLGKRINIRSTQQLAEILYDKLGLICERETQKGNKSTDIEALRDMQGQHEVIDLLIEYRKYNIWYSTFVKGISEKIKSDGRVYATFNQSGTISGRYSSSNPNLQNIPRDESELKIRRIFIAPEGYKIICADYSQLELRIMAKFSGDPKLNYAYENDIDVHTLTASQMFGVPFDEVDTEQRYTAKTINFAAGYGASPKTLRETLRDGGKLVTIDEAKDLLAMHRGVYKRLYAWEDEMALECERKGYIKSWLGRRRRLPGIYSEDYGKKSETARQGVNHVIQSTASGDVVKTTMIRLFNSKEFSEFGCKIISQVHDELLILCPEENVEEAIPLIKEIMEKPLDKDLGIALPVSIAYGDSWDQAKI